MKPLLNVFAKVLKTTLIASGGTLLAVLAGLADKFLVKGTTPIEIIAFAILSGAVTGLIAGLKRYLGYKVELDNFRTPTPLR